MSLQKGLYEPKPGEELYISVDLEASGQIPGHDFFSMLSIGVTVLGEEYPDFYRELRPISDRFDPDAMAVNQLDFERLRREGADPADVMREFADWLDGVAKPKGYKPVFWQRFSLYAA